MGLRAAETFTRETVNIVGLVIVLLKFAHGQRKKGPRMSRGYVCVSTGDDIASDSESAAKLRRTRGRGQEDLQY